MLVLLPKSSCICISCLQSVIPRCFFGTDMNIEIGVVLYMYFKFSPDYINSKYILGFMDLTPVQFLKQ